MAQLRNIATRPARRLPEIFRLDVDTAMSLTVFLCGDVMLGRGIDQMLPHPSEPQLREPYVKDARDYLDLAIAKNGPIPRPVDFKYVWGDALTELERVRPDFRIINLETSVTASNTYWPNKEIHYRMHPRNVRCLNEARIDCAVLANNHVLDFGYQGLTETLATLSTAAIKVAGAGETIEHASAPTVLQHGQRRVLVYGCAHGSSGAPAEWSAEQAQGGINFLPDCTDATLGRVRDAIFRHKQPGDAVVFSIHWGGNWGYEVDETHRRFAHGLIDEAGVDVIHGHSSHHVKGIEIYRGKLILYGCGDFIDDYEGISGYEPFRPDLRLMYFLRVNQADGKVISLEMVPMQMKRFRLQHAAEQDVRWLSGTLQREAEEFGATSELTSRGTIQLVTATSVALPAK